MLEASNQTKNNKKRANYSSRAAGEVLSHFPSTIRFIFRSKIFPKNDAQTQKHSSVQDTQWSLSSIPSIKVQSFWKYFCIFLQFAFQNAFSFFLIRYRSVSFSYLFNICSIFVLYQFRSRSRTRSVSILYRFLLVFPVRFLLSLLYA